MIAMAKAVYYPKGERQKTIIKLLNSLEGRYSRWDIWQDFIVLSAVSIANAFGGPYREQREAMYLERSKKYSTSELEVLAQMLAEVVDEMEQNPDQDMLGELFMALGLANEWKGQFFTPYDICRAMAAMNLGEDLKSQIEEKGWVAAICRKHNRYWIDMEHNNWWECSVYTPDGVFHDLMWVLDSDHIFAGIREVFCHMDAVLKDLGVPAGNEGSEVSS